MENNKTTTALQKLVDKLELIQKDDYVKNLHKYVFSLWKNELAEAKKVLEDSKLPNSEVVIAGGKNMVLSDTHFSTNRKVDPFESPQLDLPLKYEDDL